MTDKEHKLFQAAQDILNDRCPLGKGCQLCLQSEEYDEDICNRCWDSYLYKVVNE